MQHIKDEKIKCILEHISQKTHHSTCTVHNKAQTAIVPVLKSTAIF